MSTPLCDRPFARALLSRTLRRVARTKYVGRQFTEATFDQFMGKTRCLKPMTEICYMVEEDESGTFLFSDMWPWVLNNWAKIVEVFDWHVDADLTNPELDYQNGPKKKGRRARRAMGPSYKESEEFLSDKEVTLEQITLEQISNEEESS